MLPLPLAASRGLVLLCCATALMAGSACRRNKPPTAVKKTNVVSPELLTNRLAGNPSALLARQADSPIHWQPYTRQTFEFAAKANRLVLAVVVVPQQLDYLAPLNAVQSDPKLVSLINDNLVPVLVDADACRESALLTSLLCSELNRPLGLPLFLWMTPKGNPVEWVPITAAEKNIGETILSIHTVASQMWQGGADQSIDLGASENQARTQRLADYSKRAPAVKEPAKESLNALRSLASTYDPGSRSLDGCGALFPSGTLELLSSFQLIPGMDSDVTSRCGETTRMLSSDLSTSAMIDPLEGGIFNSRVGSSWWLPRFNLDCPALARSTISLLTTYRAHGDPMLLKQSLAAIAYSEKHFMTREGLFSLGGQYKSKTEDWLWSIEELEKALTADELKLISTISDLQGPGNIPIESDPNRQYFRRNSLALRMTPEQAGAKLGLTGSQAQELLDSAQKKLLKIRQDRLGPIINDAPAQAAATFRMVSTYAAAYAATGDQAWKKKALETLAKAREAFSKGPNLQNFLGTADETSSGRAFLYGLAIQATLDADDIAQDPALISWAEDLSSTAAERFIDADSLRETSKGQSVIDLPLTDRSMLFDDTSAGLLSSAQARLAQRGRVTHSTFPMAVASLSVVAVERPIIFTDQIQAALIRHHSPVVLVSADAPAELKEAVSRLPLRVISRRPATAADAVPAASVKIVFKDGRTLTASSSAALKSALGSSPPPR